ncbi:MAG: hypothetical protein NVS2B3_06020 [Vulcanimicrobiaceae bacterium]
MLAARQRLLELRSSRIEQLLRVRVALRGMLADFFETLDPIANVRLAEVSADGSKAHGNLVVSLSFFEGTRMRIAVDTAGIFSHFVSVPSAFDDVARVVEIAVSSDMTQCDVIYEPIGEPGGRKSLELFATTMALLAHAVANVEHEAREAPARPLATSAAPVTVAAAPEPVAPPRLSVAGRIGGAVAAAETSAPLRLTLASIDVPKADVLTFNVG